MRERSLRLLNKLIRKGHSRERRETELLRDPECRESGDWFLCVPACFNRALDIVQTLRGPKKNKRLVWTQGAWFSFSAGDSLFDTVDGYIAWPEALRMIGVYVQVDAAIPVSMAEGSSARNPGMVAFSVFAPSADKTKIEKRFQHSFSQDDFVRFIIAGPSGELEKKFETI